MMADAEAHEAELVQQQAAIAAEKEKSLSALGKLKQGWESVKSWFVNKIGGVKTILSMVAAMS